WACRTFNNIISIFPLECINFWVKSGFKRYAFVITNCRIGSLEKVITEIEVSKSEASSFEEYRRVEASICKIGDSQFNMISVTWNHICLSCQWNCHSDE